MKLSFPFPLGILNRKLQIRRQRERIVGIIQFGYLRESLGAKNTAMQTRPYFSGDDGQIDLFVAIHDVGRIGALNVVFPYLARGEPFTAVSVDNHINPSAKAQ